MSHRRTQIRDAIVAAVTGLPTTGANVRVAPSYPYTLDDLPALAIWNPEESVVDGSQTMLPPYTDSRELTVQIDMRSAGDDNPDELDQMALEVETAILADPTLGGIADFVGYSSMAVDVSGEINEPISVMSYEFIAQYTVAAQDPQ